MLLTLGAHDEHQRSSGHLLVLHSEKTKCWSLTCASGPASIPCHRIYNTQSKTQFLDHLRWIWRRIFWAQLASSVSIHHLWPPGWICLLYRWELSALGHMIYQAWDFRLPHFQTLYFKVKSAPKSTEELDPLSRWFGLSFGIWSQWT